MAERQTGRGNILLTLNYSEPMKHFGLDHAGIMPVFGLIIDALASFLSCDNVSLD